MVAIAMLASSASAFHRPLSVPRQVRASPTKMVFGDNLGSLVQESKDARLLHLAEQSKWALKTAVESYKNPVFPNAMIAGDCVITHLLGELGYLESGAVKIMVVDTFHLFPETMEFIQALEKRYNFKAEVFQAEGCVDKAAFDSKYGVDLWKEDIDQYDKVCKVEPFQRGLKTLETDCMINGRTRWQGFERAWIDLFENAPIGGGLAKVNPLAYRTFEDTFDYIAKFEVPAHPLHAAGYPSLGDAKDTIPIPEDGSTKFVNFKWEGDKTAWLDYASERKGRFVGLANKDGSTKTECGIHVEGAEKTFDRDLWIDGGVKELSKEGAMDIKSSDKPTVMVVYAPWCQFCQGMEDEFEKLSSELDGFEVVKYRGDEDRDFVAAEFGVESFPTISVIKSGKVIKYDSEERDAASMKEFAMNA